MFKNYSGFVFAAMDSVVNTPADIYVHPTLFKIDVLNIM